MRKALGAIILTSVVALGGCSQKGLRLLTPPGPGPDEFLVLPVKPLTAPKDYSALPAPTPGGSNLVDPTPNADAVAALGGRASALQQTGVPASDGALVAQASRYGVPANTRASLAASDAKFRDRRRRGGRIRLFPVDRYEQAYRKNALEPFSITRLFRRKGFGTPTSPPQKE